MTQTTHLSFLITKPNPRPCVQEALKAQDRGQWKVAAEWWRAAGWQVTGSSIPAEYQDEVQSIYYEKQIRCEIMKRARKGELGL